MILLRTLLLAPALAAAVLALGGCTIARQFLPSQTESRFQDFTSFQSEAGEEFTSLVWVPTDAILLATKDSDHAPGRMLKFNSETGVTADSCVPGLLDGEAPFETVWWPSGEALTGIVCNETWRVFGVGGTWYAWTQ